MAKEYEGMGLSPEEMAALEDEQPTNAVVDAPALPADDPPAKPVVDEVDDDDDDDKAKPDEAAADDEPPADPPAGEVVDQYADLSLQDFQPYDVRHVEDFDAKMAEFDKRRGALVEDFKSGELTLEDFLVKDRELKSEEDKVRDQEREAATMDKLNEQNASRTWFANVRSFIGAVKQSEGINYDNPTLNAALDHAVKTLANDKANADKPQAWFLREAHKVVMKDLGIARQEAPAKVEEATPRSTQRRPPLERVPRTLARVPAAAPNDPNAADEFSALDKLEGLDLEMALAKMSPEQAARYLRG